MKIEILGTGCAKCEKMKKIVIMAVDALNLDAEIVAVNDVGELIKRGILSTPTLIIDGKVESRGRLLSIGKTKKLLSAYVEKEGLQ